MVQITISVESKSADEAFYYQMKQVTSAWSKQMQRSKYQTVPQVNKQSIIAALMTTKSEFKVNVLDSG